MCFFFLHYKVLYTFESMFINKFFESQINDNFESIFINKFFESQITLFTVVFS